MRSYSVKFFGPFLFWLNLFVVIIGQPILDTNKISSTPLNDISIERIDRQITAGAQVKPIDSSPSMKNFDQATSRKNILPFTNNQTSNNDNMFKMELDCIKGKSDENDICQKIQNAYNSAGRRLSAILSLKTPIKVKINYKSFCSINKECKTSTLAQARASSFWSIGEFGGQDIDKQYMYPQPLIKQYFDADFYDEFDIIADINSDKRTSFWFREDGPIVSKEFEFEYIAIHELFHGLGFASAWSQYFDNYQIITPPLEKDASTGNIIGFRKLNIFDKFLYVQDSGKSKPLSDYFEIMNQSANSIAPAPPSDWVKAFIKTSGGESASNLYRLFTIPSLSAFVPTGISSTQLLQANATKPALTISTPKIFEKGSSISHVDEAYYNDTEDFLMTPNAGKGPLLDRDINGLVAGAFGSRTISSLRSIGWSINNNPKFISPPMPRLINYASKSTFYCYTSFLLPFLSLLFSFYQFS